MISCSLVDQCQLFGRTDSIYLQRKNLMSWRQREQILAERQYLSTRLLGVTSQKTTITLLTVVSTSNPTNVPGAMRPDSDAGPLCSTSLTKMPSRILPQMLNPRPVKSWLLRATTFTLGSWQHKRHHSTLLYCTDLWHRLTCSYFYTAGSTLDWVCSRTGCQENTCICQEQSGRMVGKTV